MALTNQTQSPFGTGVRAALALNIGEDGGLPLVNQVQASAFNVGLDTGVADAYIVDLAPAVAALTDGLMIAFTALNANLTNSPTLTVNGNTAPIITWVGLPISINDLGQGGVSYLIYSDGNAGWMLLNGTYSNVSASGIQNAFYTTADDAGAANAYDVTFQAGVGIGSFSPGYGSQVFFSPANTNTTASTLRVNGQGPTVIISMDGSTLRAGAIVSGVQAWMVFGKNNAGSLGWILMNPQGGSNQNGGLTAVSVSGTSQAAVAGKNYILNNAAATTVTLPTSASSAIGDTIKVKGRSAAPWIIQANTSQIITDGSVSSSSAGTATSAAGTDSLQLVYVASNEWSIDWSLSANIALA